MAQHDLDAMLFGDESDVISERVFLTCMRAKGLALASNAHV